jgi:hypothetical protein
MVLLWALYRGGLQGKKSFVSLDTHPPFKNVFYLRSGRIMFILCKNKKELVEHS